MFIWIYVRFLQEMYNNMDKLYVNKNAYSFFALFFDLFFFFALVLEIKVNIHIA